MKKLLLSISSVLFAAVGFAQPTTVTFSYTGSVQTFTVPACVNSIDVDCMGAAGGGPGGGWGGRVQCTIAVNPGDVLSIYVGGMGASPSSNAAGGYNGGGTAGTCSQMYPGGGGGGASDIRLNGTALTDRIVVGGGGGGDHQINGPGGLGGGLVGGAVTNNGNTCMATWATGGTQSAGGNPSTWSGTCCQFTPVPGGSLGIGGNGSGPGINCNGGDGGAGGGGGYYGGGGGGTYTGGGGGSSYTDPSATNVIHTQGVNQGNGSIALVYNPCTGVDDLSALATTRIFPNPSTGMVNVAFPGGLKDVKLQVLDMQGRVVFDGVNNPLTTTEMQSIDLSHLANGVYHVRVTSANSSVMEKLVINK